MPDDEKFVHLKDAENNLYVIPKHVLDFFQDLREQDLKEIKDAAETIQNVKRGGRMVQWIAISIFVTVTSFVAFGNTIIEAKKIIVRFFTGA